MANFSCGIPMHCIIKSFELSHCTVEKVINRVKDLIPETDFSGDKFSGPGRCVQIDETMLNYKCKSHRGRSATNRTDALCIIEFSDKITRVIASCIENKSAITIYPIICNTVILELMCIQMMLKYIRD